MTNPHIRFHIISIISIISMVSGCIILATTYLTERESANFLHALALLTILIGIILQVCGIKRNGKY